MARTVRDTNLETRTARMRLVARRKPYWRIIESGLHLGYRRTKEGGGTWVARRFLGAGRYNETKIGVADDLQDADGIAVKSFREAQEAIREWWRIEQRKEQGLSHDVGPYTVSKALKDYFLERERRGSKGLDKDRAAARVRIIPILGEIEITKLTTKRLRDWHNTLGATTRISRLGSSSEALKEPAREPNGSDAIRARRATANRTLTILKAALNHAFNEGRVASDDHWRKVKPFRETNVPVVRFLQDEECRRLVNSCEGAFRYLVQAALLTGSRYGELVRMQVSDFNQESGTLTVKESKAGKPRHIALTQEGVTLFSELTSGKLRNTLIFLRDDNNPWGPSHQQRPLEVASERAKIKPHVNFHILRHTYASSLAMNGAPMGVIAAQLGHADTRVTERHYAHLAPNYIADTVRATLPTFGIVKLSNVRRLG
jgi:integrase